MKVRKKLEGILKGFPDLKILPLSLMIPVSAECNISKSWKIFWGQGEVRENGVEEVATLLGYWICLKMFYLKHIYSES